MQETVLQDLEELNGTVPETVPSHTKGDRVRARDPFRARNVEIDASEALEDAIDRIEKRYGVMFVLDDDHYLRAYQDKAGSDGAIVDVEGPADDNGPGIATVGDLIDENATEIMSRIDRIERFIGIGNGYYSESSLDSRIDRLEDWRREANE